MSPGGRDRAEGEWPDGMEGADGWPRGAHASLTPPHLWNARMAIRPAYSPDAPELGCSDMASKPVMEHS